MSGDGICGNTCDDIGSGCGLMMDEEQTNQYREEGQEMRLARLEKMIEVIYQALLSRPFFAPIHEDLKKAQDG